MLFRICYHRNSKMKYLEIPVPPPPQYETLIVCFNHVTTLKALYQCTMCHFGGQRSEGQLYSVNSGAHHSLIHLYGQ